jgi:hypothetical protein
VVGPECEGLPLQLVDLALELGGSASAVPKRAYPRAGMGSDSRFEAQGGRFSWVGVPTYPGAPKTCPWTSRTGSAGPVSGQGNPIPPPERLGRRGPRARLAERWQSVRLANERLFKAYQSV